MSCSVRPHHHLLAGLFALPLLVMPAVLAQDLPAAPAESRTEAAPVPSAAGLRVYVDPATGELTSQPTPEQAEALSKALEPSLDFSTEGLVPFELSGGGRGVYLQRRFRSALVIRIDDEGRSTLTCVDDPAHALAHPAPAPVVTEWVER